eukprot:3602637-Rhodomonas_salina.1
MSETGSNAGGSRQLSLPRREHQARVEEQGLAAARPETEAQLLNLLSNLELEGTPEQVRYGRDEETPRREVQAMAPASTAPQD